MLRQTWLYLLSPGDARLDLRTPFAGGVRRTGGVLRFPQGAAVSRSAARNPSLAA